MTLYPWRRKPYDHQVKAMRKALRLKKCALLMDPRTGKTKVAIDTLSALALAGRLDRAVIIAPARVLDVWVQAFHDDCPVRFNLFIWDAKARSRSVPVPARVIVKDGKQVLIPATKKRIVTGPPPVSKNYDLSVVLVNYEAFSQEGDKIPSGYSKRTGRYAHRAAIERWLDGKPAACVLDESHKIKSPSAKMSSMIVTMRDYFDYRLILTGTPVTKAKRVFDIYQQWKFLDPSVFREWDDAEKFKNHFGEWELNYATGQKELIKLKNMDTLTERIYSSAYRVTRDECFDLPPRTTVIRKIKLGSKTGDAYDELAKEMVAQIEHDTATHTVEASIPLVLTLRLTQILGGFATVRGVPDEVPSARQEPDSLQRRVIPVGREKLEALEEIIDEAQENDEKVVVAARFKPEMNAIVDMIDHKNIPVYEVRGGLTVKHTTAAIEAFKREDGCAVMVIQPQAGGVGIDLSTAPQMIWYSLTPSWVDYRQACDRIALSEKPTTYTYLLAERTVDELLYETLQEDGDIAERILKDPRKVLRHGGV